MALSLIQAQVKAAFVDSETFRPVAIPNVMKQDMDKIHAMTK